MTVTARKISLAEPVLDEEMKEAALGALQSDRYTKGENVFKFEEESEHRRKTRCVDEFRNCCTSYCCSTGHFCTFRAVLKDSHL